MPLAHAQPAPDPAPPRASTAKPAPDVAPPRVDVVTGAGKAEGPAVFRPSIQFDDVEVRWNPAWKKMSLGNYLLIGGSAAAVFGSLAIPPSEERWDNANAFDSEFRSLIRLPTLSQQNTARDASDILLTLSINLALIDTLIVTWWGHNADTVAFQMGLMTVEAVGFASAIQGLTAGFASRQRPYVNELCVGDDVRELNNCRSRNRFRSFFSGHSTATFAIAGATCVHHHYLPLYGGGVPDALACAGALGMAAATATLRVSADQHWTSDVLTGAVIGAGSGVLVPWLLHYRTGNLPDDDNRDSVDVQLVPNPAGATLHGSF
ncbi:MAG: phosphatase PAP2 family protein [Myxococcota bacterium]